MGHELTGNHRIDPVYLGKRRSIDPSSPLNDRLSDALNKCPDDLRLAQKLAARLDRLHYQDNPPKGSLLEADTGTKFRAD